jgi:Brp/Blh family beta-carotene 15,15'-monooxygenase
VLEIFAWLAPVETADTIGLVMATAAAPLLQASIVILVLVGFRQPWAAAELAAVLSLAWLMSPLMFFLVYFCGLHSVRHVIETRHLLNTPTPAAFLRMAFPYAPLAVTGVLAGAMVMSALPPGPALISTIFMALGALTIPHMIVVDAVFATSRAQKL